MITYNKFFTWDLNKNRINTIKHRVNFQEASTVFNDKDAVVLDDLEHSQDEDRFVIIGKSKHERLLMVCQCYRENELIRIISARKAEEDEKEIYEMGGVF